MKNALKSKSNGTSNFRMFLPSCKVSNTMRET